MAQMKNIFAGTQYTTLGQVFVTTPETTIQRQVV